MSFLILFMFLFDSLQLPTLNVLPGINRESSVCACVFVRARVCVHTCACVLIRACECACACVCVSVLKIKNSIDVTILKTGGIG